MEADDAHGETSTDFKSRSGAFIVGTLLILGVGAAGAVYVVMSRDKAPDPLRVAVVLRGSVEAGFDEQLVDAFIEGLSEFGFEGHRVEATFAADDEALARARELAHSSDSGHALLLDLTVEPERQGFTTGTSLYRAELRAQLIPVNLDAPTSSDSLEFAFERSSELAIAMLVLDTWVDLLVPRVVEWLYDSPDLGPALAGDLPLEQLEASRNLRERRGAVEASAERAQGFASFCALEREHLGAEQGPAGQVVECIGDPCGQWTVVGVDADGSHAYVQDISRRPIFSIPWEGPGWAEPPERVLEVPLTADPTPRTLLRTGNIYGFAELTEDASVASVAAFTASDRLAIVTLDVASTEWRDVTVLEPGERAVRTLPMPDGTGALLGMRRSRSARDGAPWVLRRGLEQTPQPWTGAAAWVDVPGSALQVAGSLAEDRLGFALPDGTPVEPPAVVPGQLLDMLGAHDRALWITWTNEASGCQLGRVDLASHLVEDSATLPTCLDRPSLLPDGRLVGTARVTSQGDEPGDDEVVIVDPQVGSTTPLTAGPFREEQVYASSDGRRLVFNRRLDPWPHDFDLEIYRRLVCWVDVPPRG